MGLLLEPVFWGTHAINISLPMIFGGGTYVFFTSNDFTYYNYFIFVPGVEVNFTLSKRFRLALGMDYRLAVKNNSLIFDPAIARGFSGHLAFKFGKF